MRAIVRTEGLNVHARPGGSVTDQLKRGDRVYLTGIPTPMDKVTWWHAELIGDRISAGWVDGRALNFERDPITAMPPEPPYNPNWPPDMQPTHAPEDGILPLFQDWVPFVAAGVIIVGIVAILIVLFA